MTAWLLGAHCVTRTDVLLTFEPCFVWTYPIFRLQHKTFASASSRGLSAPTRKMPDAGHGWGKHTELGTAPGSSSEAVLILHGLHGRVFLPWSAGLSCPVIITGFCFTSSTSSKWRKETWGLGCMASVGGRNICLGNVGGFKISSPPLPPLFHQKEYSPWLYTQTSVLKIAKFHLDCGGVKDRRQMHWLPARLDIHFFFPHPGSQQLHTRAQVRSLVVKPTVSASPSIH